MLSFLGLKIKGGFKICRIQRNILVCGGLNFPGGLDFEVGKAFFWHWKVPIFDKFSLR